MFSFRFLLLHNPYSTGLLICCSFIVNLYLKKEKYEKPLNSCDNRVLFIPR